MSDTTIRGFGFRGYRSFYGDLQLIGPLKKVNLVAGQNNSGKSNILRFATKYLNHGRPATHESTLDVPQVSGFDGQIELSIAVEVDGAEIGDLRKKIQASRLPHMAPALDDFFRLPAFQLTKDNLVWLRISLSGNPPHPSVSQVREAIELAQGNINFQGIAEALTTNNMGRQEANAVLVIQQLLNSVKVPEVVTIEAFRQVREAEATPLGYSGENLIEELARLESPEAGANYVADEEKFADINKFLQNVLDDPTARLRIPYNRKTINVYANGRTLPLDHYGTGVHQVVIIAAAATLKSETLVCIEEPEVHLHPLLQRKLVRYLASQTTNQYLIATHSAHMLDYANAQIFRVALSESGSSVTNARTPSAVYEICTELGYRPSDLLQANAIIWVEGPSDRTYVQHWIAQEDPGLIEGVHFSIMFYGGRLLSHLEASDDEVTQFISLRRLNRNITILIDSDKKSHSSRLNSTKQRVISEFEKVRAGSAWVTSGYTIENYVPQTVLIPAVEKVHGVKLPWEGERWKNPLLWVDQTGKAKSPKIDKIKVSHEVCSSWERGDYSRELTARVKSLITFIRDSNGL